MLDDGLADDADMPGLADEDEDQDDDDGMSLNSLMFGGEDDHVITRCRAVFMCVCVSRDRVALAMQVRMRITRCRAGPTA